MRLLCVLALFAVGCSRSSVPVPVTAATGTAGHGHSHTRDKMLAADVGKYHAWLTAHLSSKTGNELDIFFETGEKQPKPAALPLSSFTAKATRAGDDTVHELRFEPAPADERPKGEAAGTCSHFVAKAPWMKPDDVLTITADVEINGRVRQAKWAKFEPKKYAHHIE
jgi:hypothetical protein